MKAGWGLGARITNETWRAILGSQINFVPKSSYSNTSHHERAWELIKCGEQFLVSKLTLALLMMKEPGNEVIHPARERYCLFTEETSLT